MSTTKTRRSVSLLAAFAVAAGALAMPAAASQAAPTFGLAATTERAPSLVDLDTAKTGSITIENFPSIGSYVAIASLTGRPRQSLDIFDIENTTPQLPKNATLHHLFHIVV